MEGPWKDVTSVLNDLSSLNIEAKTLTIDTVLTGETWALELLKDLSNSTMNFNLNLGGTTTTTTPTPGLPGQNPDMTQFPQTGGMQGTYAAAYAGVGVGVGVGGQYGATPYGNMASATPATPPTQEQPELDTDKMEEGIEETNEQINAMAEASAKVAEGAGEFASQTEAVAGAMEEADSTIITLQAGVSTFATNAGTGAANAEAAAQALIKIPKKIPIKAEVDLSVKADMTGGVAPAKGGALSVEVRDVRLEQSEFVLSEAKGTNLALPKGNAQTLMGELGPELYVTNGRYYVAGQNGPEFVDLPKDAIVFNHVKTR